MAQKSRIERGATYLIVPTSNGEVSFEYPAYGPNTYASVGKSILKRGLKIPTANQTASLLHEAYYGNEEFKDSPEAKFIREDIMKARWMWAFNRNIWTPKDSKNAGVYVLHDAKAEGRSGAFNV